MRKGFTLIEVLVVAVIVAILAAVAIPAYNGYIKTSKERVATNTAGTIASALAAYYSDFQNSKTMLEGLSAGANEDLDIPGNPLKMPTDFYLASCTAGVVTVVHVDGTATGTSVWY